MPRLRCLLVLLSVYLHPSFAKLVTFYGWRLNGFGGPDAGGCTKSQIETFRVTAGQVCMAFSKTNQGIERLIQGRHSTVNMLELLEWQISQRNVNNTFGYLADEDGLEGGQIQDMSNTLNILQGVLPREEVSF